MDESRKKAREVLTTLAFFFYSQNLSRIPQSGRNCMTKKINENFGKTSLTIKKNSYFNYSASKKRE